MKNNNLMFKKDTTPSDFDTKSLLEIKEILKNVPGTILRDALIVVESNGNYEMHVRNVTELVKGERKWPS